VPEDLITVSTYHQWN